MRLNHRSRLFAGMSALAVLGAGLTASAVAAEGTVASSYEVPDFPESQIGLPVDPDLPNIVVIDAGGTLTSRAADRISYLNYQGSVDGGVKTILEDMYPELDAIANITVAKSPGSLGSSSAVTFKTLYEVSRTVDEYLAKDDVDGVVVTAGTSVLEEDAYFLDLTVQSDKPVVVTGAMHQYGTFTYDGYTNLFSSIRLVASGKTTCYGTVVLAGDRFFGAREVTKSDGYAMDTFEAASYGNLGVVNQNYIRTMHAPARVMDCGTDAWRTPFDLSQIAPSDLAKVEIVNSYVESGADSIRALTEAGVDGIVVSGFGPGGTSTIQSQPKKDAIEAGVIFVSATRTGGEGNYEPGAAGTINSGDLLPVKARLLLQLALTYGEGEDEVRSIFSSIADRQFDFSQAAAPAETVETKASTIDVTVADTAFGRDAVGSLALTADGAGLDGVVAVSIDGGAAIAVDVAAGSATFPIGALGLGSHVVSVSYAGSDGVAPGVGFSVFAVSKTASAVSLSAPSTVKKNAAFTVSAKVSVPDTTVAPNGLVQFSVNGKLVATVPVKDGGAQARLGGYKSKQSLKVVATFVSADPAVSNSATAVRTVTVR